MTTEFQAWLFGRFIEIHSRSMKFHRTNYGSNILGDTFRNRDNVRAPIQSRTEGQ